MANEGGRLQKVSIRPGAAVLSVLRHLNYKPWFALAEFVDNAVQSYLANRQALEALHGPGYRLRVSIEVDTAPPGKITIKDNAAGIAAAEFPRAFRPAVVPTDATGLSEFGMGMKSAACWFAPRWQVRTKALNEPVERRVSFEVSRIVRDELEELDIEESASPTRAHFTEVVLFDPFHMPTGRTIGKIKDHLTDIYRVFVRDGVLDLRFGPDSLVYEEPPILEAPYERDPSKTPRRWWKKIDLDFGSGLSATGFAALRDPGNHTRSGFALFRRGRLIEGSGEEGYRPPAIFQAPGSFRHLRLFGELHLEGFEVSHTKDGFRWDDNEEPFLELLKEDLDSEDLPLLKQADQYRSLAAKRDRQAAAAQALLRVTDAMERSISQILPAVADASPVETPSTPLVHREMLAERELSFQFRGQRWVVWIELADDPAESDWLTLSDRSGEDGQASVVQIRISMAHPFMVAFAQTRPDEIEALIRVGASLALAEKLARRSGVRMAGSIRRNMNEILREALSQP